MIAGEHSMLSGEPQPTPLPSSWEWGALIAVALDGQTRPVPRLAPTRRPTTGSPNPPGRADDRALVAVVALLAVAAALLSALLI